MRKKSHKKYFTAIAIMFLGSCATPRTVDSVAGIYENVGGGKSWKLLLLKDGRVESYAIDIALSRATNNLMLERASIPKNDLGKGHWRIVGGELHTIESPHQKDNRSVTQIWRINSDNSITHLGWLIDGKRSNTPKEEYRHTHKKLN
jgi:hypothetical protein